MSSLRGYEMAWVDFEREKSLAEKTKRRREMWRTCHITGQMEAVRCSKWDVQVAGRPVRCSVGHLVSGRNDRTCTCLRSQ
jgi:hypothetical protein